MEILEMTPQAVSYNRLCSALQDASIEEERIRGCRNEHGSLSNEVYLKQLDDITGTELPECLGKIIGTLELHGPFQSLGRFVRSFSDAEFVVRCLKEPMLNSMEKGEALQAFDAFDNLIACCGKIKNIAGNMIKL